MDYQKNETIRRMNSRSKVIPSSNCRARSPYEATVCMHCENTSRRTTAGDADDTKASFLDMQTTKDEDTKDDTAHTPPKVIRKDQKNFET